MATERTANTIRTEIIPFLAFTVNNDINTGMKSVTVNHKGKNNILFLKKIDVIKSETSKTKAKPIGSEIKSFLAYGVDPYGKPEEEKYI